MEKTYLIENYGCQMNLAEAVALRSDLDGRGWVEVSAEEAPSVVILNTCSVRLTAEERIWGRLEELRSRKRRKEFRLILTGCMATRLKEEIGTRCNAVDITVAAVAKSAIPGLLEGDESFSGHYDNGEYHFFTDHGSDSGSRSLLPVMHGCNNFCSYCIVPYLRGREKSRSVDEVVAEVGRHLLRGKKDITLLGQNVNSYRDRSTRFPELLREVAAMGMKRLRFVTSHPRDFGSDLIDVIASEGAVCNHVHLPVQHGSSRVLGEMNRGYTAQQYLAKIAELREKIPHVAVSTDILVGFPGETNEDFEELMMLMKEVRFNDAYTYLYNPIPGTSAADRKDQIPEEVKKERLSRVINLRQEITRDHLRKRVGDVVEILVEGVSKKNRSEVIGRTEMDERVVFTGTKEQIGQFAYLRVERLNGETLRGEVISDS